MSRVLAAVCGWFIAITSHAADSRPSATRRTPTEKSHIGKLARGLDEGPQRGWDIVSMKNDWKIIHPPRTSN